MASNKIIAILLANPLLSNRREERTSTRRREEELEDYKKLSRRKGEEGKTFLSNIIFK